MKNEEKTNEQRRVPFDRGAAPVSAGCAKLQWEGLSLLARIPHKRTNQSMECTCCEAERRIEHLAPRDSRRCRFFEAGHANRDEADQEEPERPPGEAWEDLHTVAKAIPSILTTERPCYQGHRRKRPCYQSHRRNVAGMKKRSDILAVTGTEPASRSFKTRCDIFTVAGTKSHKTTTRDASTDTASRGEEESGVASFRREEPRVRGLGVQKQFGMSHKRWNAYMKAMHGNGSEGDEWEEIEKEVSRETEELRGHMAKVATAACGYKVKVIPMRASIVVD